MSNYENINRRYSFPNVNRDQQIRIISIILAQNQLLDLQFERIYLIL